MDNKLKPAKKVCGHCGRWIMSNPKIHSGKGMRPHKCKHGRWCDRGNPFLVGNNTPGCKLCEKERQEFYDTFTYIKRKENER